jgi:hypothetical protein
MEKLPVERGHPGLARLLAIGSGEFFGWGELELEEILRHQLRAPLLADLRPDASQIRKLGLEIAGSDPEPPETFGDLLDHPGPSVALLSLAKDYAKTADKRLDDPLPPPVAQALYVLLIAAAFVRLGERISTMDDAALRVSLSWAADQQWIEDSHRQLANDALASVHNSD